MATIERVEDIKAWQSARELRQTIYRLTRRRPFADDFALVAQIRRAAISMGSNIAEGFERGGNRELIQFFATAKGSAGEIKDQLCCAFDEAYISKDEFEDACRLADVTSRLIGGFMTYLRTSKLKGYKFEASSR